MASDSANEHLLAPGHRLDGYELLWPVGEGGMATVWVARLMRKHGFEKLVAIKTILPKFAEDEQFQKMFLDEARIASRIDHTNVAHIHDLGEQDGVLYIVMEYVDGDALTRLRKVLFKKGISFPVPIALRVMADVCAGLHAAHDLKGLDGTPLGVVHRDVSPQNVLISAEGVSKLIDFGVAKAEQRLTEETHTGFVKGKVQYMAPEQALGKNVDRRADVWAVGAVIYHLIANKPPFEADNQLALLSLLQRGRPPAPLPPTIPFTVQEIVKKALTHNMQARFQTALEMKTAIEKTGMAASQEEVAAFLREHLADFAERRKGSLTRALQQVDAMQSSRQVSVRDSQPSINAATQRISTEDLPRLVPNLGPPAEVWPTTPLPHSESRIGPPTPQSFAVAPRLPTPRRDELRMTAPLNAIGPGVLPPHLAHVHQPPPSASLTPNPRPQSVPTYGSSSRQQTTPANLVPQGLTEPLPSPEQIAEAAAAEKENTNGGSLGLASISASVSTKRPGSTSWVVISLVAAFSVMAAVGIGLGVRGLGAKKFEQFSTLPAASQLPSAATPSATVVQAPKPEPTPADSMPIELPSADPTTPAPSATTTATAHPTALGHPAPFVTGNPGGVHPAPAGSGKKKPRIDDGF